jgi:hypothetical protein
MRMPDFAPVHDTFRRGLVTSAGDVTDAARATPPSGIHRRGQQVRSGGGQKQQLGQQDTVPGQ